jgi:hypothetical protein
MSRKIDWETATRAVLGHEDAEHEPEAKPKSKITLPRLKFLERPLPPDVKLPPPRQRG